MTTMELLKTTYEKLLDDSKFEEINEYKLILNLSDLDQLKKEIKLVAEVLNVIINYGAAMKLLENSDSPVPFPKLINILDIENDRPKQENIKAFLIRNLKWNDVTSEWIYSTDVFKLTNLKLELRFDHSKEAMGDDATINTLKEEPKEPSGEEEAFAEGRLYYRPLITAVIPTEQETTRIAELLRSLVYLFDWNPEKKKELIQFIKDGKWWPSEWLPPINLVNKLSSSEHSKKDKPTHKKKDYSNMERSRVQKMAEDLRLAIMSGITGKLLFDNSEDVNHFKQIFKVGEEIMLFDYWDLLFELIILGHREPHETKLPMIMQQLKESITDNRGFMTQYQPDTINGDNIARANKFITQVDKVLKSTQDKRLPVEVVDFLLKPHKVGKVEQKEIFIVGGPLVGCELRSSISQAFLRQELTWRQAKGIIEADAMIQEGKARANQEDKQTIISQTEKLIKRREKGQKRDSPKGTVNQLVKAPSNYSCPICGENGHWGVDASGTKFTCPDIEKNPGKYTSDAKKKLMAEVLAKRKKDADAKAAAGGGPGRPSPKKE